MTARRDPPLRVLGLVPYPVGRVPGQRYRIEQWAPHFQKEGLELTFSPFLSDAGMDVLYRAGHPGAKLQATARGYAQRLAEAFRRRTYDVAYVYRETMLLAPAALERALLGRMPFVFDFDVPI